MYILRGDSLKPQHITATKFSKTKITTNRILDDLCDPEYIVKCHYMARNKPFQQVQRPTVIGTL